MRFHIEYKIELIKQISQNRSDQDRKQLLYVIILALTALRLYEKFSLARRRKK